MLCSSCSFIVREIAFEVEKPPKGVYRGSFHVHSKYSHDSKATLEEIRLHGERSNLDFVFVTDHNNMLAYTEYRKSSLPPRPLLVFGNEISTTEGHLIALGVYDELPPDRDAGNLIQWIHGKGGFAVIPHATSKKSPWLDWKVNKVEGMEVYNFFHSFYSVSIPELIFEFIFYPRSKLLSSLDRDWPRNSKRWDSLLRERKAAAIAGTDAHIHFRLLGWTPESLRLSYQSVSTFVLAGELTQESVTEAIGRGRTFIAFEIYGDAGKFTFEAESEGLKYRMGDVIPEGNPAVFRVSAPVAADIKLLHNGAVVSEKHGTELEFRGRAPGVYRTEVYRDGKLWIAGSPVYVDPWQNP